MECSNSLTAWIIVHGYMDEKTGQSKVRRQKAQGSYKRDWAKYGRFAPREPGEEGRVIQEHHSEIRNQ